MWPGCDIISYAVPRVQFLHCLKLGGVIHTCNSSTWAAGAGASEGQGDPQLYSKFETCLGSMRLSLQKNTYNKNRRTRPNISTKDSSSATPHPSQPVGYDSKGSGYKGELELTLPLLSGAVRSWKNHEWEDTRGSAWLSGVTVPLTPYHPDF